MKILCPTDYSKTSINALHWLCHYVKDAKLSLDIELLHCIEPKRRTVLADPHKDVEKEIALSMMKNTIARLKEILPQQTFSYVIVRDEAKRFIVEYVSKEKPDWIVIGTKGLSDLKEITVGSIADHCIQKSKTPVLAIPPNVYYKRPKKLVLGIDAEVLSNESSLSPLFLMADHSDVTIELAHVQLKNDHPLGYDPGYDIYFKDRKYSIHSLLLKQTVSETLKLFAEENHADVLFVIHKERHWLSKLFHYSVSKSEMFDLSMPLFVLQHLQE